MTGEAARGVQGVCTGGWQSTAADCRYFKGGGFRLRCKDLVAAEGGAPGMCGGGGGGGAPGSAVAVRVLEDEQDKSLAWNSKEKCLWSVDFTLYLNPR